MSELKTVTPYTETLVQLRKCVLLRTELDNAMGHMIDMLDGKDYQRYTGRDWALMIDAIGLYRDGADGQPCNIGPDTLDDLIKTWKGR